MTIYNTKERCLEIARQVTQEFIDTYNPDLTHLDELNKLIAKAIEKESSERLLRFIEAL
jgi:hypothetical protein